MDSKNTETIKKYIIHFIKLQNGRSGDFRCAKSHILVLE